MKTLLTSSSVCLFIYLFIYFIIIFYQTLLSLSKLSGMVSSGSDGGGLSDTINGSIALEDDSLSLEEELIHYQEQLPESVLSAHFLDPDTMRVLSPTELIHVSV